MWYNILVFYCKQKRAYEMRSSDGSSDVCSSDLFDADAVFARLVIARLVGKDHARLQRLVPAGRRDPLRPFVHRKEAADAVAGAMREIEADIPQMLPGQHVKLAAARTQIGRAHV